MKHLRLLKFLLIIFIHAVIFYFGMMFGKADSEAMNSTADVPKNRGAAQKKLRQNRNKYVFGATLNMVTREVTDKRQRLILEQEILTKWIQDDWRAALDYWLDDSFGTIPISSIKELLVSRSDEIINGLVAGEYGLDSSKLYKALFLTDASISEDKLHEIIQGVSPDIQRAAIYHFMLDFQKHDILVTETLRFLGSLNNESAEKSGFQALCSVLSKKDPVSLVGLLSSDIPIKEENRAIVVGHYSTYLSSLNISEILSQEEDFPTEYSNTIINEALRKKGNRIGSDARKSTEALTELMIAGKWKAVDAIGIQWVKQGVSSGQDDIVWAKWAVQLPADQSNNRLFRTAVSGYFEADPIAGKEWIDKFPDGWAKTQALSQLIITAKSKQGYGELVKRAELELKANK